jgi:methylated-DNA-protein-cysteine methyltransferase-like protein
MKQAGSPAVDEAERRICAAIARVPRGRVATYGGIAAVAGLPGRARLVGTVLRNQPENSRLPWFRIINAGGRISFPEGSPPHERQRSKLQAEGVRFVRGRINLKEYGWPDTRDLDEALWGRPLG